MAKEATAAEIRSVMRDDVGPQVGQGDPVADLYMQQLSDPEINTPVKPFESIPVAEIEAKGSYVFVSKPGYRLVALNIPVPEQIDDDKIAERQDKIFARKYRGNEARLAELIELTEELGTSIIAFKPYPGKFQCSYDTDSDAVATYIRQSPEFAEGRIYEVQAPMTVMVNGQQIKVVPADQDARLALSHATTAR